jgi:energy-coupling factor transporter transmembrane protein EcfT
MSEKTAERDRFNWRLMLYAVLGTFVVFVSVAIWTSEGIFYLLVVAPIISLFLLIFAKLKKRRQRVSILSMLVVYWAVSAVLVANYSAIRETSRWLVWSRDYKAEVLTQKGSADGQFKHIEWDGWGFPGAGDTTVYLVFDPEDLLAAAARSDQHGTFSGIPCKVDHVRRLESHWYSVRLYTDEYWDRRNPLAC